MSFISDSHYAVSVGFRWIGLARLIERDEALVMNAVEVGVRRLSTWIDPPG
jgi:hypothetical protein